MELLLRAGTYHRCASGSRYLQKLSDEANAAALRAKATAAWDFEHERYPAVLREPSAAAAAVAAVAAQPAAMEAAAAATDAIAENTLTVQRTVVLTWGWGGEYRLGHGTGSDRASYQPGRLHPVLKGQRMVGAAIGSRHSLTLTASGRVYGVGEVRWGQLALLSALRTDAAAVHRMPPQRVPAAVLPSGALRHGRDCHVVEIAAGDTCSFAREINGDDACAAIEGLRWMLSGVAALQRAAADGHAQPSAVLQQLMMPSAVLQQPMMRAAADGHAQSSAVLQQLMMHLQSESDQMHRRHRGRLLAWGTGAKGQLGLGPLLQTTLTPRLIPSVRAKGQLGLGPWLQTALTPRLILAVSKVSFRSVVAGHSHVLAVALDGRLFSWGAGKDGRLGHGDYKDRCEPAAVAALAGLRVLSAAAGAAHSLAITAPGERRQQQAAGAAAVWLWGRGAHGRLGLGDRRNRHTPALLQRRAWPVGCHEHTPIKAGNQTAAAKCDQDNLGQLRTSSGALGGAHTLLLCERSAPWGKTRACPWARTSVILAWGFGGNGQLGVGEWVAEVLTPRRVDFNKGTPLLTDIAAGKAHSLACCAQGRLYATMTAAPVRVQFDLEARHAVTAVRAGPCSRHSAAIAIETMAAKGWEFNNRWKLTSASHGGPDPVESAVMAKWRCPRRHAYTGRGACSEPMFACAACGMDCVCLRCARLCHRGHAVAPCTRRRRVLCQCGMRCADLLSSAAAGSSAQGAPPCRLEVPLCDSDGGSDALDFKYAEEVERRWDAAQCVQRFIRGHLARLHAAALRERKRQRRRQAAEVFWNEHVLGPIMARVSGLVSAAQLSNTRATMQRADAYSLFVARYRRLQPCLQAMDLCRDAVAALLINLSAQLLTARAAADPRVLSGAADAQRVAVWSTAAARQHKRALPPKLRMTHERLLQAMR
ncbi:regulator of chromosome condensation 1/beta-lactamase-inhibitor protein II [Tribonema minus]|uniref:Regulator of chromosome condensation 1/beta-lactamase-inhibitor protein II n=1 Tax=Tribonema minus TaxID=303371 RepID=A0A836C846_9STRA|nr:regulator of chromosome condensation 1/beta-lactamase-inhibitor protein II [Tribonema minus]